MSDPNDITKKCDDILNTIMIVHNKIQEYKNECLKPRKTLERFHFKFNEMSDSEKERVFTQYQSLLNKVIDINNNLSSTEQAMKEITALISVNSKRIKNK